MSTQKRSLVVNIFLLFSLAAAGCGTDLNGQSRDKKTFSGSYPVKVLCTTGMVADLVRNVGGEHVRVEQLMGAGVDPHRYMASTKDIARLRSADIIFYSGLHLEGKLAHVLEQVGKQRPAFAVADFVEEKFILRDKHGAADPHLWFDVSLWSRGIDGIRKVLAEFDPAHASHYQARAKAYQSELALLHEEVKAGIASIPTDRRVLATAHDAFHYFGRAYNIEVKGIQGISTESEASVKDINDLVEFLSRRAIKAVFIETSVPERNMQSVLDGCRARGHTLVVGGTLFSDAMGRPGTPEGTYAGMIRHNLHTIVGALK